MQWLKQESEIRQKMINKERFWARSVNNIIERVERKYFNCHRQIHIDLGSIKIHLIMVHVITGRGSSLPIPFKTFQKSILSARRNAAAYTIPLMDDFHICVRDRLKIGCIIHGLCLCVFLFTVYYLSVTVMTKVFSPDGLCQNIFDFIYMT